MDTVPGYAEWTAPAPILFGCGRIRELPDVCRRHGVAQPLIVCDPGVRGLPFFQDLVASLEGGGAGSRVFDGIESDPDSHQVVRGAEDFLAGACDGVVAVGGGSVLDAAKAIALCANAGDQGLWHYKTLTKDEREPLGDRLPPVFTVPTTAGTGSEVNGNSVITHPETGVKVSLYDPGLMPRAVFADPEVTVGLPPHLTAFTGLDALGHNLEALCVPGFYPIHDAVAVRGISYVMKWLERACEDGTDLKARSHMMSASIMGALAFEKGLGGMHALAHAAGSVLKGHHGRFVATAMPFVLEFNRDEIDGKFAAIHGLDEDAAFDQFLEWTREVGKRFEVPGDLVEAGLDDSKMDAFVQVASEDVNGLTNPIELTREKLMSLIARAAPGLAPA